jgi:hypothetical protein
LRHHGNALIKLNEKALWKCQVFIEEQDKVTGRASKAIPARPPGSIYELVKPRQG